MGLGIPEKSGDTLCEKAWDAEDLAEKKEAGRTNWGQGGIEETEDENKKIQQRRKMRREWARGRVARMF